MLRHIHACRRSQALAVARFESVPLPSPLPFRLRRIRHAVLRAPFGQRAHGDGLGDGAVSLARGRLEGVADTEILPFHHLQMFDGSADENVAKLREAVLKRLKAAPAPPEAPKP